jgi:ornithine cyclodeaminase/alanine dehydrogenase-like protein (mu-crystallin family)
MTERLGVKTTAVGVPREAVEGADIIITAGPIKKPAHATIEAEWVSPGSLGVALDYDAYWTPDYLVSDDIGQIQHLKESGFFLSLPRIDAEIGEVIGGMKPRRADERARILAFNLGIALEDLATAAELYRRARDRGVGQYLPL